MFSRRLLTVFAVASIMLLGGSLAAAQDTQPAAQGKKAAKAARKGGAKVDQKVVASLKEVKPELSAEQNAKVEVAVAEWKTEMAAWSEKNKEELSKLEQEIKAAKESGDKAKTKELNAKRAELNKSKPSLQDKIKAILTPEQVTSFEALNAPKAKGEGKGKGKAKGGDKAVEKPVE